MDDKSFVFIVILVELNVVLFLSTWVFLTISKDLEVEVRDQKDIIFSQKEKISNLESEITSLELEKLVEGN